MRIVRMLAVAASVLASGTALASSPIPANQIDDFGSVPYPSSQATEVVTSGHASPIPSNYIDDFGSLETSTPHAAPAVTSTARASPIPSNYVDDFGVGA